MKKTILIIIVLAAVVGGCKKYEEGPLISFRSAKNRVYGYHTLSEYKVNGIDSIEQYKDSLGVNYNFYYSESSEVDGCTINGVRNDGNEISLVCKWKLINNNKVLYFYTAHGPKGVGPLGNNKTLQWEILRLTKSDLKMKTNYNGKEYVVDLKAN
jgi:hypothetical protein